MSRREPIRVYAPVGMLGYGFPEASLQAALEHDLAAIGVDAGSTDPGPYYLGSGTSFTSRQMVKRDLALLLPAALAKGIPLLVGSCGGSGARPHLEWTADIVREIAREQGLRFRMALIPADIDPDFLKRQIAAGRVHDFEAGHDLTPEDVDACPNLVAQMGAEPICQALDEGADIVLAGRAYDAALPAAVPLMRGFHPGLAWHMGKIAECGSMVALPSASDGVIVHLTDDYFDIEPADPNKRCSVDMVAAHSLYEKSDPRELSLPGGKIDLRQAAFEQRDARTVRVSGSRFEPASRYMVKLEGAAQVGFRSLCIAGARDPLLIENLDSVVASTREKIAADLAGRIDSSEYQMLVRVYGRDGVMGPLEPLRDQVGHEVGLVIEVVAQSQESADVICGLARATLLHVGDPGRKTTAGNLACPYSPAEFAGPPAYEFRVYHLMEVDNPCMLFPASYEQLR
jgi:hypothetical protein